MKRTIHNQLKSLVDDEMDDRVIVVEGARQVGKSYLVNDVLKDCVKPVLSFDLEKTVIIRRQIATSSDFKDFTALLTDQYGLKSNSILFFDEAQESRKLAEYVKSMKEDWKAIKVILTGSSMNRFFSDPVRIPVGRLKSLCVFGFSFAEFIRYIKGEDLFEFILSAPDSVPESRHRYLLDLFDQYLLVGGYPEAVKAFERGDSFQKILEDIIFTLEEDFQRKEAHQPG